jgi:hypothetical protein
MVCCSTQPTDICSHAESSTLPLLRQAHETVS